MARLGALLTVVIFAFSAHTAWCDTFSDLPKLEGDVFAVQVGEGEKVALIVFQGQEKYSEYHYTSSTATLVLIADGEISYMEGDDEYHLWRVAAGSEELEFTYDAGENPSATLHAGGVSTGMVKVDYSNPSGAIPVLYNSITCPAACAFGGCCQCCFCVHRELGLPYSWDWLCCRWAGITCVS